MGRIIFAHFGIVFPVLCPLDNPSVTDSSIGTEALPSQRMLACTQTVLYVSFR